MSAEIEEKVLRNLKNHEELSDILKSTLYKMSLEGFEAFEDYKNYANPDSFSNVVKKIEWVELVEDDRLSVHKLQKIKLPDLSTKTTEIMSEGNLTIDQFLVGYIVPEDKVIEEIKKGNELYYVKDADLFYKINVDEF
ncbi:hypothetical protein HNP92_000891 [Methanococcus maripaludis]|uniref:Uncharacterized protein n=1 Tax=Methanococcus maripaludis TaxID=39152 RepID=A0A7J9S6B2_METMI|nr:hypothetical protein [Methanococcus maripaludis]MBB6401586.1 hypothetical protein [Methanococcus maripaludis]